MLYRLVDEICSEIDSLSLNAVAPALEAQIMQAAPEAIAQVIKDSQRYGSNPTPEATAAVLALSAYGYIQGIPTVARQLLEDVRDEKVPVARRAAIASVLAYLAQPGDLISDDLPGGYGFLDDAVILRAGLVACRGSAPRAAGSVSAETKTVGFLISLTPAAVRPALQQAVTALSHRVQVMSELAEPTAAYMLAEIIANPLKVPVPVVASGFTPKKVPNYAATSWAGGACFDGNQMQHLFAPA
jgi:uncharacterized membrane protein YkvA (DUF1232 family)